MFSFLSPTKVEDPLDDFSVKKSTVKSFQGAMEAHDRALRQLSKSLETCLVTLQAVAVSLHNMAADAQVVPVAASVSGALQRGLADITAGEGSASGGVQWEDLQEEIEFSLKERFSGLRDVYQRVEGCRKRRTKAQKELEKLTKTCDKLSKSGATSTAASTPANAVTSAKTSAESSTPTTTSSLVAATQKKEQQELEFKRLSSEFEDSYAEFCAKLGAAVQEDVAGLSEAVYEVLAAVVYHFRKCQEAMKAPASTEKTNTPTIQGGSA